MFVDPESTRDSNYDEFLDETTHQEMDNCYSQLKELCNSLSVLYGIKTDFESKEAIKQTAEKIASIPLPHNKQVIRKVQQINELLEKINSQSIQIRQYTETKIRQLNEISIDCMLESTKKRMELVQRLSRRTDISTQLAISTVATQNTMQDIAEKVTELYKAGVSRDITEKVQKSVKTEERFFTDMHFLHCKMNHVFMNTSIEKKPC